jgi:hypothetical protein
MTARFEVTCDKLVFARKRRNHKRGKNPMKVKNWALLTGPKQGHAINPVVLLLGLAAFGLVVAKVATLKNRQICP